MTNLMNKNKGKIRISTQIVEECPDMMFCMLSVFIPVLIEHQFNDIYYTYYGYCEHFDEIKEGEEIPEYDITFKDNKFLKARRV